jgi:arylsulfatase A-like enzyme
MSVTRRRFLAGALAAPAFAKAKKKTAALPHPSVLLILAEDLGSWMLGCYGNTEFRTPNIDRLAQTGVRFGASYAASGSAAAGRAALSGKRVTASLGAAGYQCAETSFAEAGAFLDRQKPGAPFFLTVTQSAVRAAAEARYTALYADAKFEKTGWDPSPAVADPVGETRKAAAAVTAFDDQVAGLLKRVKDRGLLETTSVILTSVSGWLLGQHGVWGDGAASDPPNLYEQVVNVPLIWSWLGRTPPLAMRPELASVLDLAPSLYELAGAAAPDAQAGRSLVPLALNRPLPKKQPWRGTLYARLGTTAMARDHRYKIVLREKGPGELYDLVVDKAEKTNQFENQQFLTVRQRLTAAWEDWKKRWPA